jgi:hypothetical protein
VLKTGKNINLILHFLGAEKLGVNEQLNENSISVDIVTEKVADELRKIGQLDPNTMYAVHIHGVFFNDYTRFSE